MRARIATAVSLFVLAGSLAGCEVITGWYDSITGGAQTYSGARISFSLEGNVARSDAQTQETVIEVQTMIAAFSASGMHNATNRTFTATWDGGDFSDTTMVIRLSATEESVESFELRQTRVHSTGAWTESYVLAGHDAPLFHRDATAATYVIDGTAAATILDEIDYREWSKNVGSSADPYYRLVPPQLGNVWGSTSSYIEVQLFR